MGVEKSPTAEDFADITELAEEGEPAHSSQGISSGRGGLEAEGETREEMFQRGMAFAQAQLSQPSGSGLTAGSMETDYDEDSEDILGSQPLPSAANDEGQPLSQQDSGYESLPLSDPAASSSQDAPSLADHTPSLVATPTALAKPDVSEETGKIESAIPYLIPKDMSLEQLHAKASLSLAHLLTHSLTHSLNLPAYTPSLTHTHLTDTHLTNPLTLSLTH